MELVEAPAQPRVVHEDLDRLPVLRKIRDHPLDPVRVADVEADVTHRARARLTEPPFHRGEPITAPRCEKETGTLVGKRVRAGLADPTTRPRDKDNLIAQSLHSRPPSSNIQQQGGGRSTDSDGPVA